MLASRALREVYLATPELYRGSYLATVTGEPQPTVRGVLKRYNISKGMETEFLLPLFEGDPVSICYSPQKGRYIVCNKDIEPGEAIFEHYPAYATAIDPCYKNSVCNTCLNYIKESNRHNMSCCSGCGEVYFCSFECKASRRMDTYHTQMECAILSKFSKQFRSGLSNNDILIIRLILRILCRQHTDEYEEQSKILMSLVDHTTELSAKDTQDFKKVVDVILSIEEPIGIFSEAPERIFSLAAKVKSNNFGIWTRRNGDPVWCGAALYLKSSFFNHSCFPNCSVIQDSNTKNYGQLYPCGASFTVRSLGYIPKGGELCISYIGLDGGTATRQKTLQTGWSFVCTCERCVDPASDQKSIAPYCCRTPKCSGGFLIPTRDTEAETGPTLSVDGNNANMIVGVCRVCFASAHIPLARNIFS